jgi:predicted Zn-dependent protease
MKHRHRRYQPLAPVLALGLAGATLSVSACAVNPATGERQLSLVSESQEIQIGRDADEQIVASMGLYPDEAVQRYVSDLGQRLAADSERPDLPWTFRVVDDPTVNAFALPGGFIYVTRGILGHLGSEAELAGVLGHEIGHVTARHSVNQMSRAQLAQIGLGVGMIFSETVREYGDVAGAGMQLMFLKFGRDDESEADRLGVRYMMRERYDPRELANVMQMLARTSEMQSGSGRVPEWLATHPDPGNRSEAIMANASEMDLSSANVVEKSAYLHRVDGMVFGPNPREGFTRDGVFHHPDLAFRLTVPGQWQVVNGKRDVQFISPEQDGVVVLTLAEGDPSRALSTFLSQEGLRAGAPRTRTVNGMNAASAEFEAETQQGTLAGEALFIRYDGNTYRLLGLAPASRWSSIAPTARNVMGSFQRETNAEVLAVRPDRIDLVTLDRSMSLENFMQSYPSTIGADLLALINQVPAGGTVPAGLAKRVVEGR